MSFTAASVTSPTESNDKPQQQRLHVASTTVAEILLYYAKEGLLTSSEGISSVMTSTTTGNTGHDSSKSRTRKLYVMYICYKSTML